MNDKKSSIEPVFYVNDKKQDTYSKWVICDNCGHYHVATYKKRILEVNQTIICKRCEVPLGSVTKLVKD